MNLDIALAKVVRALGADLRKGGSDAGGFIFKLSRSRLGGPEGRGEIALRGFEKRVFAFEINVLCFQMLDSLDLLVFVCAEGAEGEGEGFTLLFFFLWTSVS